MCTRPLQKEAATKPYVPRSLTNSNLSVFGEMGAKNPNKVNTYEAMNITTKSTMPLPTSRICLVKKKIYTTFGKNI